MKTRLFLCAATLLATLPASHGARAANDYGDDEVVVALLDSGVRATHDEFDYGGPDDPDDQMVGWWDFTNLDAAPLTPGPGQAWDPRNPDPYDDNAHGTGTASLAVGLNAVPSATKQRSYAPGTKFAEAKVCDSGGACGGDLAEAIRWATDTIGADVISISIGSLLPLGDLLNNVHEAAGRAREAGVLTIVANGNGLEYTGLVPDPGWFTANGDSTNVLTVGGSDVPWQAGNTTDPEVAARFFDVPLATNKCDACYSTSTGTSFATPLVAGMAARAMQEAIANGVDPTPDYIETLLKYSARDTESPPTFEGYGVLDDTTMTTVLAHAAAGSLPARPDPDLNGIYVDTVMATLRDVSSNKLDSEAMVFVPTGLPIDSGPGRMSAGMEAGYVEGERYTVSAGAGERVTATLDGTEYPSLFSLYAYEGTGPTFSEPDLVAARSIGGENGATISFRSPDAEVYTVLAVGRFVPPGFPMLPFTLTATGSDGAQGIFDGEDLYATTTTFLGIPG